MILGGLSILDFSLGLEIQYQVHHLFGSSVSFSTSSLSREFFLVASFSRCATRINYDSAALIIQSFLGGIAHDFNVDHLLGFMYRFFVNSKLVGLFVARMKKFECPLFVVFFCLWVKMVPIGKKNFNFGC